MLTKQQKEKIVEEFVKKLKDKKAVVFSDFTGLNVKKLSAMRNEMRKEGIEYKVVKKTLLRIALERAGFNDAVSLFRDFKGSCGLVIGYGEEIAAPKLAAKFSKGKDKEKIIVLGGLLGDEALQKDEIFNIALIPSREVLLGQLVYALGSPITGFMNVLNGNTKKLIYALQQIQSKKS